MKVTPTDIADVLILEPKVFGDARGFFYESYNEKAFEEATGFKDGFVQDNHSRSSKGVLRGLHFQVEQPQGKLVRAVRGAVLDVVVDIRPASATFGRWISVELSEDNHRQLWVPPGLAHGFVVVTPTADFLYKTTEFYAPQHERCLAWNDPVVAADWQLEKYGVAMPSLSAKDAVGMAFDALPTTV